jgi:hypothetical protein
MILGLLLALASALATNLAFLLKYRGAVVVPPIRARYPLHSAATLFRSKYLAAILGGILVVDGPIGAGPLRIGARFLAFCLVIIGAALMPTHAEQLEPDGDAA